MPSRTVLMASRALGLAVSRMAHEIAERQSDPADLVLLGVQRGGVHLGRRLATELEQIFGRPVPVGELDASLHRDDLDRRPAPAIQPTRLPGDINGRTVLLIDDVLCSGRTARAALDALHDFGRPRRVQLGVLVDRGHRELPIKADFVARKITTTPAQRVEVRWTEDGGDDTVAVETP